MNLAREIEPVEMAGLASADHGSRSHAVAFSKISGCYCLLKSALACSRNCRAAVKGLLVFKSFELPSKTIGWAQAGQLTDNPLRIFEWCSLNVLVHSPQTILILDIRNLTQ